MSKPGRVSDVPPRAADEGFSPRGQRGRRWILGWSYTVLGDLRLIADLAIITHLLAFRLGCAAIHFKRTSPLVALMKENSRYDTVACIFS